MLPQANEDVLVVPKQSKLLENKSGNLKSGYDFYKQKATHYEGKWDTGFERIRLWM